MGKGYFEMTNKTTDWVSQTQQNALKNDASDIKWAAEALYMVSDKISDEIIPANRFDYCSTAKLLIQKIISNCESLKATYDEISDQTGYAGYKERILK